MSGETMSRRVSRGGNAAGGVGSVVRPHSASDSKTVMESLVHFFQDVVAGAETGTSLSSKSLKTEGDAILWARFETSDLNELGLGGVSSRDGDAEKSVPALLLILGYANGAQVWAVAHSGEASELFSLRNGPIKSLKFLPQPEEEKGSSDRYSSKRPLVAICESASSAPHSSNLKFVSLGSGEDVHAIAYKQPIVEVLANRKVIIASFHEKFVVLDALTLKHRFWVGSCYPSSGPNLNPLALSCRWLAYADRRFVSHHQSYGGVSSMSGQSYTSTVISAAKSLSKGLTALGETVASSLAGGVSPPGAVPQHQRRGSPLADQFTFGGVTSGGAGGGCATETPHAPGVISIVDVTRVEEEKFGVTPDVSAIEGLVAHFLAHANEPIASIAWNQSGQLLFTADRLGHTFNIFKILSHPLTSSFAAVHHLYSLHRGETTSKVQDVAFSLDSRWVAVSTFRGTTHVFPITPYGGPISTRTHLCSKVVNRASRFHKSAGIDEIDLATAPPHSPTTAARPSLGSSPSANAASPSHLSPEHHLHPHHHHHHHHHYSSHQHGQGNPRAIPMTTPTIVHSVAQIKQPLTLANAIPGSGGTNPSAGAKSGTALSIGHHHHHHHHHSHHGSHDHLDSAASICVATAFGKSRGWLGQHAAHAVVTESPFVDALFVMGWHGGLLEYILEPYPTGHPPSPTSPASASSSATADFTHKHADETPIDLLFSPRARWMLRRLPTSPEFVPPLPAENPLLRASRSASAALRQQADTRAATWSSGGISDVCNVAKKSSSRDTFQGLLGPGDEPVKAVPLSKRRSSDGNSDEDSDDDDDNPDEEWLSQVEMVTYEGPHRRLWMGPQFAFKVVNPSATTLTPSSSALFADVEPFGPGATIATLDTSSSISPPAGGAAPVHATAGKFDSLMHDINLESLKLTGGSPTASSGGVGGGSRSNPVDMPTAAASKSKRRPRTSSNLSNASDSRKRHGSGDDSSSLGNNVLEVFGSWPDSPRPELSLGSGVGVETIGEEGFPLIDSDVGKEHLLKESLAEAMLEAALGCSSSGGDNETVDHTSAAVKQEDGNESGGGSSRDASGEFFIASEELPVMGSGVEDLMVVAAVEDDDDDEVDHVRVDGGDRKKVVELEAEVITEIETQSETVGAISSKGEEDKEDKDDDDYDDLFTGREKKESSPVADVSTIELKANEKEPSPPLAESVVKTTAAPVDESTPSVPSKDASDATGDASSKAEDTTANGDGQFVTAGKKKGKKKKK